MKNINPPTYSSRKLLLNETWYSEGFNEIAFKIFAIRCFVDRIPKLNICGLSWEANKTKTNGKDINVKLYKSSGRKKKCLNGKLNAFEILGFPYHHFPFLPKHSIIQIRTQTRNNIFPLSREMQRPMVMHKKRCPFLGNCYFRV